MFTLSVNGDLYIWDTITDGATQIVLICEEEKPRHVFRVTTFDTELQGFIQGYIIVPGKLIVVLWTLSYPAHFNLQRGGEEFDVGKGTSIGNNLYGIAW